MLRESVADRVHRPGSERPGTATLLRGIYYAADGTRLALGGKTGTGDLSESRWFDTACCNGRNSPICVIAMRLRGRAGARAKGAIDRGVGLVDDCAAAND